MGAWKGRAHGIGNRKANRKADQHPFRTRRKLLAKRYTRVMGQPVRWRNGRLETVAGVPVYMKGGVLVECPKHQAVA